MTAALAAVLALWLAIAPAGPSGRRVRAALSEAPPVNSLTPPAAPPGRWCVHLKRRHGKAGGTPEVSMTVVVQQLAALLKGGRTPARLWEELGAMYGCAPPGRFPGGRRTALSGPTLNAASLQILAAARAAAMRGSPVATAIRWGACPEPGSTASRGAAGKEQAVWVDLAACFDVAEASGCPLAEVLARFAAHLEAGEDAEAARQTALAGPQTTVRILTWLPFLGLGLGVLLGVDPPAVLLGTPLGMACLGAGLALTAAGRIWSARLVRSAAGRHP